MKKVMMLLLLLGLVACGDTQPNPEPDPPDLPPIEEPVEPTPEPEPEPEPTPEPPPNAGTDVDLYVPMRMVEGLINGTGTSIEDNAINHGMIWGAGRAFRDAANQCRWSCADPENQYFGLSCDEMHSVYDAAVELEQEGNRMIERLRTENRRCDSEHRLYDPAFIDKQGRCRRSNVRWEAYNEFRERHDAHLNRASELTAIGGACQSQLRMHGGSAFDTLGGWCQSANKARTETGFNALKECP